MGKIKRERVKRDRADVRAELSEQLSLLRTYCRLFDEGDESFAKPISMALRVLLHEKRDQKALLVQLAYRSGNYYSTGNSIDHPGILGGSSLIGLTVTPPPERKLAWAANLNESGRGRWIAFEKWWGGELVVKTNEKRSFSRSALVLHLAETDGGGHSDEGLDPDYMKFSRGNSMGMTFNGGVPENRPERACVRQIAHEVLTTLSRRFVPLKEEAAPILRPDPGPIVAEFSEVVPMVAGDGFEGVKASFSFESISPKL